MKKRLLAILLMAMSIICLCACAEGSTDDAEAQIQNTAQAEPNTSAKVDEILLKAKNDAETFNDDEVSVVWEEGFDYLKSHSSNFFESNEVMEQSMYYGGFIYQYIELNATASDISELEDTTRAAYDAGYNTVKAIKYVYRNAATPEDSDTVNALAEAQAALDKFN